jgi:hypothetical protein
MSEQSTPKKASNLDLLNTAFLDGANASYIETMYAE